MIKPDGNVDEALKWFAEYTKAAKTSKGHSHVSHTYNPETREIIAIDVICGPNAMVRLILQSQESVYFFHSTSNHSNNSMNLG